MKLDITERLNLLSILPEKGNALTLRVVREAREALSFDSSEHATIGFETRDDGTVTWPMDNDPHKDVSLSLPILGMIKDTLTKLNDRDELDMPKLDLYERFVDQVQGRDS